MNMYWSKDVIERPSTTDELFPFIEDGGKYVMLDNLVICVSGKKDGLSVMMADRISDLHYVGDTAIFPLYYYKTKVKNAEPTLFDAGTNTTSYKALDGITDWIVEKIRNQYGDVRMQITKEDVFYYVYGILHSEDYRRKYKNDLAQSLPWIPIVEELKDFRAFVKAGRNLAEIHLNYESQGCYPGVEVEGAEKGNFRVEKMKYLKVDGEERRDTIIYNEDITIKGIPLEAYGYILNSFPAIHHILDRYYIRPDAKGSGIINDPNDWAIEHGNPRYILDLLLSVINVSMKTINIIKGLPKLNL